MGTENKLSKEQQQSVHPTLPEESVEMLRKYKQIMYALQTRGDLSKPDKEMIKKAFRLAVSAHDGMRRKGGDPYIYHPLEVARICVSDIGLGPTAVVAALLHDVVEDTDYTLADIQSMFGDRITLIVDGLTKIKELLGNDETRQKAFNHQKIIFTLASDVRVILIKLADRLHNMRTLDSMPAEKQIRISTETQTFFAPLAHRLGLYAIKTELENLAFKYLQPGLYTRISNQLNQKIQERNPDIKNFILPIKKALAKHGFSFKIKSREKSVYSIYNKMVRKSIEFDAVQDIFAVRIIIDVPFDEEKDKCWAVYSLVSSLYRPNIERLRDWISTPKSNGYQALHTTVMSDFGEWVEVQIRSKRMDEIAEKGYAAHWKYKGEDISNSTKNLDHWLDRIRDMLQNPKADINEFMESFRGFLFTDEVFVFTPKGELRILPNGSTILDFAYGIHTSLGDHCIGAEVNHHLKPLNYEVQNGDQIKILDSTVQLPKEEWLKFVKTSRAQNFILDAVRREQKKLAETGELALQQILDDLHIDWREPLKPSKNDSDDAIAEKSQIKGDIRAQLMDATKNDMVKIYCDVASGAIGKAEIQTLLFQNNNHWYKKINLFRKEASSLQEIGTELARKNQDLDEVDKKDLKYIISECCNPIPGDDIMAIPNADNEIEIHRASCKKVLDVASSSDKQPLRASWKEIAKHSYLTEIYIQLFDTKGILFEITKVLLQELDVNLKSVNIESTTGIAYCRMKLFVNNLEHLTLILERLRQIEGVAKAYRWNKVD